MAKKKPNPYPAPKPLPPHLQIALDFLSSPKWSTLVGVIASSFAIAMVGALWDLHSRVGSADYGIKKNREYTAHVHSYTDAPPMPTTFWTNP